MPVRVTKTVMASLEVINGEQDTQQPIADLYLMMKRGDPKLSWVNPEGGHMGDSAEYPSSWIRQNIIQPWLFQRLGVVSVTTTTH